MENLKFAVYRDPAWGSYAVAMFVESTGTIEGYVPHLMIESVDSTDASYRSPTVRLTDESVQQLMDELWRAGIRPNNGESSIAHVDAMREHLNDMRAIVSKELGVDF